MNYYMKKQASSTSLNNMDGNNNPVGPEHQDSGSSEDSSSDSDVELDVLEKYRGGRMRRPSLRRPSLIPATDTRKKSITIFNIGQFGSSETDDEDDVEEVIDVKGASPRKAASRNNSSMSNKSNSHSIGAGTKRKGSLVETHFHPNLVQKSSLSRISSSEHIHNVIEKSTITRNDSLRSNSSVVSKESLNEYKKRFFRHRDSVAQLQQTLVIPDDKDFTTALGEAGFEVSKDNPDGYDNHGCDAFYDAETKRLIVLDPIKEPERGEWKRLILKNGATNTSKSNLDRRKWHYIGDWHTTLLELKWKWTTLIFFLTFVLGWLLFALVWFAISQGDIDVEPCVEGVKSFVSALLFSVETQQTIGYGTRAVTEECPSAVLLVMLQSLFGVVVQCVITGIIFAKLSLAKKRANTILFSKNAVISKHNKHLSFMFRVGDMRKCHMICVTVSAILVRQKSKKWEAVGSVDEEEDHPEFRRDKLHLVSECDDLFFMAWPMRLIHRVDEASPLWTLTPELLANTNFEIIVVLEGINETTGMTTQVRTSYLPGEILWGHKLAPLLTVQKHHGQYNVDYTRFHDVVPVDTHELSAKEMRELKGLGGRRRSYWGDLASRAAAYQPRVSTVEEEVAEGQQEDDRQGSGGGGDTTLRVDSNEDHVRMISKSGGSSSARITGDFASVKHEGGHVAKYRPAGSALIELDEDVEEDSGRGAGGDSTVGHDKTERHVAFHLSDSDVDVSYRL